MTDSVLGSIAGYDNLSDSAKALFAEVLQDQVGGLTGTTFTTITGGTLAVGQGAGGVVQGVVVTDAGAAVTAELNAGSLQVNVGLPAGVAVAFQGQPTAVAPAAGQAYVSGLIEEAMGPAASVAKEALLKGTTAIFDSMGATAESVNVNIVSLNGSSSNGTGNVTFTGQADSSDVMAFVMSSLTPNQTLVMQDVNAALIVGGGSVQVQGSNGAVIAADTANQVIIGGAGNDTLIGGGGHDTLTGGEGANVFGVNTASGSLVLADFNVKVDKLAFNFDGINRWEDLGPYFTGVTTDAQGNAVAQFGDLYNITFVGLRPEDITTDFLKFDI